jgi:hypothetical protein
VKFLLQLYESQLKKLGGAECIKSFGMIGPNNQIIYYLVFATKHLRGLEVMKEAMWNVDPTGLYKFSDITGLNQSLLMDFQSEPFWVKNAANVVYQTVDEEKIHQFVVAGTQYLYRKTILQFLEKVTPPKIIKVSPRKRAFSYPEGCSITFSA